MLDQYKYSALKDKLKYHGLDQAKLNGSKWRYTNFHNFAYNSDAT